jgi:gamma-F420-2:alpha-L-glutamate ligase
MSKMGWLIYSKKDALENSSYIDWFIEEARLQDLNLTLVLREDLTIGLFNNEHTVQLHQKQVTLPQFAVVRTIEPLLSLHLEKCGIKVFNSSEISHICNHKSLTHLELNKLNIPMVDMIFMKKENLSAAPPMDFPFAVKEATGRSGKQVYFIQTSKDWEQCYQKLSATDLVIQSTQVQVGKDIRVFIVGKEIIGAVLRESNHDFRANFKLGGTATWYPLHSEQIKMIHKIIHHFDFDMVGIDFLIGLDGEFLFNEIEDVVGSRILSAVSDINILEKYVAHIKFQL